MANTSARMSRIAMPLGSVDYILLQQEKMARLHNQIEAVEDQMFERGKLMRQIERLKDEEDARTARVLSRLNGRESVLSDEVARLYGTNTAIDYSDSPVHAGVIDDILTHRTKEHSLQQQDKAMQIKYLNLEKRRLQEARERLHEKKHFLARNPSPIGKRPPLSDRQKSFRSKYQIYTPLSYDDDFQIYSPVLRDYYDEDFTQDKNGNTMLFLHQRPLVSQRNLSDLVPEIIMAPPKVKARSNSLHSVHSQGSYVRRAVENLPKSINRIWKLREDIERDYQRKSKPYTGHLGLESYLPYQLEDYVIVRKLVEDFVDDCLRSHIIPDPGFNNSLKQRAVQNVDIGGVWSDLSGSSTQKKILQLVMEELVLEQTRKFTNEIVEEVIHLNGVLRNKTDFTLMNQAERISTGKREGRQSNDPAYNTITRGYYSMVDDRDKHRKDVWGHSQHVHIKADGEGERGGERDRQGPTPIVEPDNPRPYSNPPNQTVSSRPNNNPPTQGNEPVDADTEVLNFNHITPTSLRKYQPVKTDSKQIKQQKVNTERYINREIRYWQNMKEDITKITLSKKCKGIETVRPSPDSSMIAIGTVHGDVIVYDVNQEPWRVVRLIHNSSAVDDGVIDIAWTLDNSKLVTINKMGSMQVWTFDGGGIARADAKGLDIQADPTGFLPLQLERLVVLDDDMKDFSFKQGPFSEQGVLDGTNSPVKAAFYPSFSFLGSQHSVCVGLNNGDMLKCNLEPLLAKIDNVQEQDVVFLEAPRIYQENIYDEKFGVNLIGESLEAELYRHHKHPVIYLGFIHNMTKIVTVDQRGFINIWHYDGKYISNFGWFTPFKKLKLDLVKKVYTPADTGAPNIKFTDREKSKKKSKQDIARERQRVQNLLNNMMLGDPWHEEELLGQGLTTSIYAPKGAVKDTGSLFNVIIKHTATDQLSSYLTRMYKPVKIPCKKLVEVQQSSSGTELIFMLLFPEFPPKDAHLTILVLDLKTFKLRDIRKDIKLTNKEYNELIQQDNLSFDVSHVFGTTGADYLYLTINGQVRVISLNTGSIVMRTDNTDRVTTFPGLTVEEKLLSLMKNSKVISWSTNTQLSSIYYSQKSPVLSIMKLEDQNTPTKRRMMVKSSQMWGGREKAHAEQRIDSVQYYPSNNQPIEVDMRSLVLELVDKALVKKGVLTPPDSLLVNSQEAYKETARQVQQRGIL
ncbi:hypothetical protein LOTGIDRAFT_156139 [Lottia gigantea]|uniref:Uncharacterized protein n=1 Tax=Lottia gigantea TaxID=225164 RepID=V4CR03_LOTGI|nr:hypothetical protein LOTGIDRAFT_156139 [Lottia gigantea]ESP04900.1 hypothetical protein LOTGIDRAFT_156139 [Lottia gigantea]